MRILINYEESGVLRRAFRAIGHDAWSCDLKPPRDDDEHHIQRDAIETAYRLEWDLMVAHPPCTYLCSSGLHWNKRVPLRGEMTLKAIGDVRDLMAAPIPKIAIENPVGRIGTAIREADQYIHPHHFGDDASKRTGLWLINLPILSLTGPQVPPRWVCCCKAVWRFDPMTVLQPQCPACGLGVEFSKARWGNQTDSGQNRLGPSETRAAERATTYEGIARAMAIQWGGDEP